MQLDSSVTRLFVADLHLESPSSRQFQRFRELLTWWKFRATGIYLLGDITEMWIGDDDDAEMASALRDLLRETTAHCPVFLMHGNRDFLYGRQLAAETGARLLDDPTALADGLLIAHGDAFCVDDVPYQKFRATVRSPSWQADVLGRSMADRRTLGASMRAQSRSTNANKAVNIMDVNDEAIAMVMRASDCHSLVHGHTHRPGRHALPSGERLVVGSWDGFVGWYALQDDGRMHLHTFSLAHRYGTENRNPVK